MGGITDEDSRKLRVSFDFLQAGKKYAAIVYSDAKDAHWKTNPEAYMINKLQVGKTSVLDVQLAPGGRCGYQYY